MLIAHTLPSLLLPCLSSISPNLSSNMLYLTTQIAPNLPHPKNKSFCPMFPLANSFFFSTKFPGRKAHVLPTSSLPQHPGSVYTVSLDCTSRVKNNFLSHLVGTFWPLLLQVRITQWFKNINNAVTSRVLDLDFAAYLRQLISSIFLTMNNGE